MFFFNSVSFAETKPDCSQYSSKTLTGLMDKKKCKKGEYVPKRKRAASIFDLNPFKPRDGDGAIIEKRKLECGEHSTKTLTGLAAKLMCKKKGKK
jgi:hypothetical protein